LNIDPNMNTDPNTDLNRNTNLGISANILSLMGYLFFPSLPLVAIIAFVIEKDNKFVRFHSLQSMFLALVEMLLPFVFVFFMCGIFCCSIPFILSIPFIPSINLSDSSLEILSDFCGLALGILYIILYIGLRIFLAIQAFRWQYFKLPIIGQYVERVIFKQ